MSNKVTSATFNKNNSHAFSIELRDIFIMSSHHDYSSCNQMGSRTDITLFDLQKEDFIVLQKAITDIIEQL
jgi:hypothetical protein